MDFELYSRVTGSPMPMSAAERMKMAPEVYQFTKDYTKSRNQAMGRNILKIGALGTLGVLGSRAFGTPSQELGQEITETSTAANLVENAAEKAAQSVASNTVSQSLARDQTPKLTEENAAVTAEEPSMLNKVESQIEDEPLLGAGAIREKYSSSRVKNPARRARELESDMIGSESSGPDMLRNFVTGMTKKELSYADEDGLVDTQLQSQSLSGTKGIFSPLVDDSSSTLTATQYGAYASPLTDHPDMEGGEDDINIPGGTNTSATTNLSPKVLGIAVSLPKNLGASAEEKLIIANEIDKKRQLNPLEQRAEDNKAAVDSDSMRLSDEERKKESIRIGSTGGIPNKTDMVEIRKDPEYIAAQESMRPKSATEKTDNYLKQVMEDLNDPDAMMDKPEISYKTSRAGRQEVGLTQGGDYFEVYKNDPQKTYITRLEPTESEAFEAMAGSEINDDKEKRPDASKFLDHFKNLRQQEQL